MGCELSKSCKDEQLVQHLMINTGFTEAQIHVLHRRFKLLDTGKKDFLDVNDFRNIHDFDLNPLANRIIFAMYRERELQDDYVPGQNAPASGLQGLEAAFRNPHMENVKISFESFVRCFARFRVFHDARIDTRTDRVTVPTAMPTAHTETANTAIQAMGNQIKQPNDWKDRLCSPKGKARFIFHVLDLRGDGLIKVPDIYTLL